MDYPADGDSPLPLVCAVAAVEFMRIPNVKKFALGKFSLFSEVRIGAPFLEHWTTWVVKTTDVLKKHVF